ncbi:hypothetical protein JSE7799_01908 [Jannaschia seosinensis]|uniref:Uncharacterized protein n=1 Tax=Jannaschia seosinensis TaxID=313367 RepID=A0A0M7BCX2_9RHOB|nr:hypothetical protein JSE7799_01908 [Jannaschia seosinensis]
MTDTPKILLAEHLKTLKLPTLPRGSMKSSPASAPPRGWIMSSSWRVWSSWN